MQAKHDLLGRGTRTIQVICIRVVDNLAPRAILFSTPDPKTALKTQK